MKLNKTLPAIALMALVAASISGAPVNRNITQPKAGITGDYVEARTASVFAGACHYNGELVCNGREAVMAWSFNGGNFNGVDLAGVRVLAAVSSPASLGDEQADRKSELTIDSSATEAQSKAVQALIEAKAGSKLGKIVAIHRAPVSFTHNEKGYTVNADGIATMDVQPMPDAACCTSPGLVWFSPLAPIQGHLVGYTEKATYAGGVSDPWQRYGENSAFYGEFSF